jgi:protein-S-isoprenylcysteine O-methyltransferase Ste14
VSRIIELAKNPRFVLMVESILAAVAFAISDATPSSLFLGACLVSIGASMYTWAAFYFVHGPETGFGFGGPYRFVRYPVLLSRFLVLLGLLLSARNPWLFLLAVSILGPFYQAAARKEDRNIQEALGPLATEYKASVSGFVPQLLPVRLLGQKNWRQQVKRSWWAVLWSRPSHAGFIWIVLTCSFIWQYVWTERYMFDWQWRLSAVGIIFVTIALGYKYARQLGLRAS